MAPAPDGSQHTLFQNVDVLFIGATAAPEAGSTEVVANPGSNLMTLAVPQEAAQRITFARAAPVPASTSHWSRRTISPPPSRPSTPGTVFTGGLDSL